jgi:NADH-quinone oxidoreductase subunit N
VYQGSPAVIAALLAWIPKAVGFVAILRVLTSVLAGTEVSSKAITLVWIIAVVTMTLGNFVALQQQNLKRLFAYSSIAHAGYLMVGVAVAFYNNPASTGNFLGSQGILFYLVAYALMTLGAFAVIIALSSTDRTIETVDDFAGLGWSRPLMAFAMALCLFSLAGVPPMAGFWGKFYIFASAFAVGTDEETRMFRWLAVIGVLNAAVGAYYYLRIVVMMYLRAPETAAPRNRVAWPTAAAAGFCASLSLLVGIYPPPVARATHAAALAAIAAPAPQPAQTAAVETTPVH